MESKYTDIINFNLSSIPFKSAINAVKECRTVWGDIDTKARALPEVEPVRDGTAAVERRKKELEVFDLERKAASAAAIEKIKAAAADFGKEFDNLIFPHGEDFEAEENKDDYNLLCNRLITSPQELAVIYERHRDSAAFRRLISRYADIENWTGFKGLDLGKAITEFAHHFFNECVSGCESPFGYSAAAVTAEGELARRLNAYGITDNFTEI